MNLSTSSGKFVGTSISGSYNGATGVLTLSGVDTFADYQTVLNAVQFGSTSDNPTNYGTDTSRTLSYTVSDGLISSDPATATVTVVGTNDAPTATITQASYTVAEQTSLSLKNTGLSVADVDGQSGSAILSVGEGTLTVAAGSSGATVSGSGTKNVTISGTLAQINALLSTDGTSTVSYIDNTNDPGGAGAAAPTTGLTLSIDDNGNTGTGGAQTGSTTKTINITPVNDAPDLTPNAPAAVSYTENASPTALLASGAVSDPDGPANFSGGSFEAKITAGDVSGDEIVLLGSSGLTVNAGSLQDGSGNTLGTISGLGTDDVQVTGFTSFVTPTVANQITEAFGFDSTSDDPGNGDRTVTFTFNDGGNVGGRRAN